MNKLISLKELIKKEPNFKEIGLKAGIEIHQQLETGKLFCNCPCKIIQNEQLTKTIIRKLRFSTSETGEIDAAALDEIKKEKINKYIYNDEIACLVDLDEEPPHEVNRKALSVAIRLGFIFNLNFVDKIQFMRKLIVDGSIISGFQRTALIGLSGKLQIEEKDLKKDIRINGLNLEEDASRIIERKKEYNIYALDRQGIPLIEITTAPDIETPEETYLVAKRLGDILRSFKETKRGLGTIRQDLNISIKNGCRVEIKGAQNLKLLPEIVKYEVFRQIIMNSIIEELKEREIDAENYSDEQIYELTKIFAETDSKIINSSKKEHEKRFAVKGIKLRKFKNILGHEIFPDFRFATEISKRINLFYPEIKGLFHSDELPKYGITENETDKIKQEMNLQSDDGFIIISGDKTRITKALKLALNYIKELLEKGLTEEVRKVDPKGYKTTFLRKMPGSARMYPETDLQLIELNEKYLLKEKKKIPERFDLKIERLSKIWTKERNKIIEILENYAEEEINELLKIIDKFNTIYYLLIELQKEITKREKIKTTKLDLKIYKLILKKLSENKIIKDRLYDIIVKIQKTEPEKIEEITKNFENFLKENNFLKKKINYTELENTIKKIINENPKAPFGALMGICMQKLKNQADGKTISEILKKLR